MLEPTEPTESSTTTDSESNTPSDTLPDRKSVV